MFLQSLEQSKSVKIMNNACHALCSYLLTQHYSTLRVWHWYFGITTNESAFGRRVEGPCTLDVHRLKPVLECPLQSVLSSISVQVVNMHIQVMVNIWTCIWLNMWNQEKEIRFHHRLMAWSCVRHESRINKPIQIYISGKKPVFNLVPNVIF